MARKISSTALVRAAASNPGKKVSPQLGQIIATTPVIVTRTPFLSNSTPVVPHWVKTLHFVHFLVRFNSSSPLSPLSWRFPFLRVRNVSRHEIYPPQPPFLAPLATYLSALETKSKVLAPV